MEIISTSVGYVKMILHFMKYLMTTSKHTVNMTNCRTFALKETDLCKICFVYMCKFTWGYGLYRATDKLNWSMQLLI